MVRVKPFAALRPPHESVTEVAAPPYDVLNSEEALKMAGEKSLLHITKPEIDFDPILPDHDQRVYDKAVENFRLWRERGILSRVIMYSPRPWTAGLSTDSYSVPILMIT